MLYMLLICYSPAVERGPDEPRSLQPQHAALEGEMAAEGVYVSGAALMPPAVTPIVRVRGGKATTLDGRFAETKELLGGYYIVDCKDAAEAAKHAARIPVNSASWIDVMQMPLFHADVDKITKLPGAVVRSAPA
jgi:hypothetical protein